MKIGLGLGFSDSNDSFWVSHLVVIFLCDLIDAEGYDEIGRKPKTHSGLDVTIRLNSLSKEQMEKWPNNYFISEYPGVHIYNKHIKPRGYDWTEVYVCFPFEILKNSKNRIQTFLDMCLEMLVLVEKQTGIRIFAIEKWKTIEHKMLTEAFNNPEYKFNREVDDGIIIY